MPDEEQKNEETREVESILADLDAVLSDMGLAGGIPDTAPPAASPAPKVSIPESRPAAQTPVVSVPASVPAATPVQANELKIELGPVMGISNSSAPSAKSPTAAPVKKNISESPASKVKPPIEIKLDAAAAPAPVPVPAAKAPAPAIAQPKPEPQPKPKQEPTVAAEPPKPAVSTPASQNSLARSAGESGVRESHGEPPRLNPVAIPAATEKLAAAAAPSPAPTPVPAVVPVSEPPAVVDRASLARVTIAGADIPENVPNDQIRTLAFLYTAENKSKFDELVQFVDSMALHLTKKPLYLRKSLILEIPVGQNPKDLLDRIRSAGANGAIGLLTEPASRELDEAFSQADVFFRSLRAEDVGKRSVALDLLVDVTLLIPG